MAERKVDTKAKLMVVKMAEKKARKMVGMKVYKKDEWLVGAMDL